MGRDRTRRNSRPIHPLPSLSLPSLRVWPIRNPGESGHFGSARRPELSVLARFRPSAAQDLTIRKLSGRLDITRVGLIRAGGPRGGSLPVHAESDVSFDESCDP